MKQQRELLRQGLRADRGCGRVTGRNCVADRFEDQQGQEYLSAPLCVGAKTQQAHRALDLERAQPITHRAYAWLGAHQQTQRSPKPTPATMLLDNDSGHCNRDRLRRTPATLKQSFDRAPLVKQPPIVDREEDVDLVREIVVKRSRGKASTMGDFVGVGSVKAVLAERGARCRDECVADLDGSFEPLGGAATPPRNCRRRYPVVAHCVGVNG